MTVSEKKQDFRVIVDSREQKPYWNSGTIVKKLDVGDYSLEYNGNDYSEIIAIERKTLPDIFGTLGKGHSRFKKELERAQKLKYFAIVIDGSLTSCLNKDFEGSYHSRMKGYVILKILCTIQIKYGIPFFFTNGRVESKRLIKELFNSFIKIYNNKQ